MQTTQVIGKLTAQEIWTYIEQHPSEHVVLQDEDGEWWSATSPEIDNYAAEQVPTDDWQRELTLIRVN